jgi:hypothetical protein
MGVRHSRNRKELIRRSDPLSFCQELLFLNGLRFPQFRPVIAEVVLLSGPIDPTRICRALSATIVGHEPLRSRYVMRRGVPRIEVLSQAPDTDPVVLMTAGHPDHMKNGIKRAILAQIDGLDVGKGRVVTSTLMNAGSNSWLWMLAIHHLASDGWSQHIYGRSFSDSLKSDSSLGAGSKASSIDRLCTKADEMVRIEGCPGAIGMVDRHVGAACRPTSSVTRTRGKRSRAVHVRSPRNAAWPGNSRRAARYRPANARADARRGLRCVRRRDSATHRAPARERVVASRRPHASWGRSCSRRFLQFHCPDRRREERIG